MSTVTLEHNTLMIAGDVTFETVASLYHNLIALLESDSLLAQTKQSEQSVMVDFSQVNTVNSAALALMIEAKKYAAEKQLLLKFDNLPEKLRALAQVCGVDAMLLINN